MKHYAVADHVHHLSIMSRFRSPKYASPWMVLLAQNSDKTSNTFQWEKNGQFHNNNCTFSLLQLYKLTPVVAACCLLNNGYDPLKMNEPFFFLEIIGSGYIVNQNVDALEKKINILFFLYCVVSLRWPHIQMNCMWTATRNGNTNIPFSFNAFYTIHFVDRYKISNIHKYSHKLFFQINESIN